MHRLSKGLASIAASDDNTDTLSGNRPRARSSLDTFIIPGRTRIPSTKPDPTDVQLSRSLLNAKMHPYHGPPPACAAATQDQRSAKLQKKSPTLPVENEPAEVLPHSQRHPIPCKVRSDIAKRPPPRLGGRDLIIVPHRRSMLDEANAPIQAQKTPLKVENESTHTITYDGAQDSGHGSRLTSMTWRTVSHRVFTDSSHSSRGLEVTNSIKDYNDLATRHGLPEFAETPLDDDNQTKTTTKTHHHGWLSRKIFRRTSSTYNIKVKAIHKPLPRKRSLGRIPSFSDFGNYDILKDKTLEEISRLGGLGVIVLPEKFAVDKLTLPTCLSTAASYLLQHGCNKPGLFRISGQTSTVNALYDYYAHQFSQAGSPSKVQETVGSGLLPSHIEHTLPDVASFFKKVLIGLPGGLLGSMELFEALRSIFLKLEPENSESDTDLTTLRAKLVALAISSIASAYRVFLIQAVLGLVAYFGHEAEKTRAESVNSTDQSSPRKGSNELMGCQSLGVVLGPLLLGNLIDKVCVSRESLEDPPRPSSDSIRKNKKQKRVSFVNKLEKDATLTTHVDRANLTAGLMEMLLILWPNVVKELQIIQSSNSTSVLASSDGKIKRIGSRNTSRLLLRTSDEENMFLDVLRGRTLPDEFRGEVKMKRKVRVSSRSPMARELFGTSSDTLDQPSKHRKRKVSQDTQKTNSLEQQIGGSLCKVSEQGATPALPKSQHDQYNGSKSAERLGVVRTRSDVGMENMAMGTLLPSREHLPSTPAYRNFSHPVSPEQMPDPDDPHEFTNKTPRTAVRNTAKPESDLVRDGRAREVSLDKPLPSIGAVQMAENLSPPTQKDTKLEDQQQGLLSRCSSSPSEGQDSTNTDQSSETLASRPPQDHDEEYSTVSHANSAIAGEPQQIEILKDNSVQVLARKFAEASRAIRKASSTEVTIPTVYAYVHTVPLRDVDSVGDPFHSPPKTSPERETLIPKPVKEAGRGRNTQSRSPSPSKLESSRALTRNPLSGFDQEHGAGAKISRIRSSPHAETSTKFKKGSSSGSTQRKVLGNRSTTGESTAKASHRSSQRSTSNYSSESLRQRRINLQRSSTPLDSTSRRVSIHRTPSRNPSESLIVPYSNLNGGESAKLGRRTSANATLYAEIQRLKRQLEQKTKEVHTLQKSRDAIMDSKEIGTTDDNGIERSVSKGTLSAEIYEARRELNFWRTRAECAERRLQGRKESSGMIHQKKSKDSSKEHQQSLEDDAICGLKDSYIHSHQGSRS